jgi:hypothetical protein
MLGGRQTEGGQDMGPDELPSGLVVAQWDTGLRCQRQRQGPAGQHLGEGFGIIDRQLALASAALLWAGLDNHGVLAKGAAADPDRMPPTRMSPRLHAKHVRELPDLAQYERAVGERACQPSSRIVLVGYPAWMVPQWGHPPESTRRRTLGANAAVSG